MSTLKASDLIKLRKQLEKNSAFVGWTKLQADVALQASENYINSADAKNASGAAIETAQGATFSQVDKDTFYRVILNHADGGG